MTGMRSMVAVAVATSNSQRYSRAMDAKSSKPLLGITMSIIFPLAKVRALRMSAGAMVARLPGPLVQAPIRTRPHKVFQI